MMSMPRSEFFNFIYSFYKEIKCEELIINKINDYYLEIYLLDIIDRLNNSFNIKFDFHIKNPERIIQYKKDKDYTIILEKIEGDVLFDEKFYIFDIISNIDLNRIGSFGFLGNKKAFFYYELEGDNVYYELSEKNTLINQYKNKVVICCNEDKRNIDEVILTKAYLINFLKEKLQDLEVDLIFSKSFNLSYLLRSLGLIKEAHFIMINNEDILFSKEFMNKLNEISENRFNEEIIREFEEFNNKKIIKVV